MCTAMGPGLYILTVQYVYGDGGRLGVAGPAEVVSRVGAAGRLNQQVRGGCVTGGRDDADAAARRAEAHHLGVGGPHHTSQCLENTDRRRSAGRGAVSASRLAATRDGNMPIQVR